MSVWTHVVGIISVDEATALMGRDGTGNRLKELRHCFGTTELFDTDDKHTFKSKYSIVAPSGSEGSIRVSIEKIRRGNSFSFANAYLWGSLRDFDSDDFVDDFKRYCDQVCKQLKDSQFSVRSFVIDGDVEGHDTIYIYRYSDEKEKVVLHRVAKAG